MSFLRDVIDFNRVWIAADRDVLVRLQLALVPLLACVAYAACVRFAAPSALRTRFAAACARLEARPARALLLLAAAVVVASLALRHLDPPLPFVHDERSLLLQADTFASGRLTNPPHPFWEHFESFHIINQPTYQSKYPPGQGAVLALGQVVFREPLVGVWLSVIAASLASFWALGAFLRGAWAFVGAAWVATFMTFGIFGQGYMGGPLPALGGALVLGAAARPATRRAGLAMGAGLAALAVTRPYEGAILGGVALLFASVRSWQSATLRPFVARLLLPAAALVAPTLLFVAYYNRAVTGDPFLMPYVVHDQEYIRDPILLFMPPNNLVTFRNHEMRELYALMTRMLQVDWQLASVRNLAAASLLKAYTVLKYFLGFAGTPLLLVGLVVAWRRGPRRLAAALVVVTSLALLTVTYALPHYAAPMASAVVLLAVLGAERIASWRPRGRPVGLALVLSMAASSFIALPANYVVQALNDKTNHKITAHRTLAGIVPALDRFDGKHLVFVRYDDVLPTYEWVYNEADIDAARIVWARDLGEARNAALMGYYGDRSAWMLRLSKRRFDGKVAHRVDLGHYGPGVAMERSPTLGLGPLTDAGTRLR